MHDKQHNALFEISLAAILVLFFVLFILLLQRLVKERTAQLARAKHQLQATLDALPDLLFEIDAEGRFHDYHSPRTDLLAAPPDVFLGKTVHEVLPPEVAALITEAIAEAKINGFATLKSYALMLPQGQRWFSFSLAAKPSTEPHQLPRFISLVRDVTEQILNAQKLARTTKIYAALSQCNQAIVRCQSEEELFPSICRDAVNFGGLKMAWIGKLDMSSGILRPVVSYGDGKAHLDTIEHGNLSNEANRTNPASLAISEKNPVWCQDFLNDPITYPWHTDAKKYGWNACAALPLTCQGEIVGTFNIYLEEQHPFDEIAKNLLIEMAIDISFALDTFAYEKSRQESAALIEHLANYDSLTGLPNRALLRDRVHQAIANVSRSGQQLALMFLDLDHFKNVNDSLGHNSGDELLRVIATRLLQEVREQDTVSRWGGDEFILMLPDCSTEGAARVAEKLLSAFNIPCQVGPHELHATLSIGVAMYPSDGSDFESLTKAADAAMYRSKHEGRNTFRFFTAAMQTISQRYLRLENDLNQAITRNELYLDYQPIFSVTEQKIIGVEALLRWQHPVLGLISPTEFIAIAEITGQIIPIGSWVLQQSIKQTKAWEQKGLSGITLSVNLSAAQFRQSHLIEHTKKILAEHNLSVNHLCFELTESMAMEDTANTTKIMDDLHEAGIAFVIDDFGTGYSSLASLKRFRVAKIKIDQSFVRDIVNDANDRAIVDAIITMAKSLGYKTVAEGVETFEQLAFLKEHGCDEVQGYLYSQPLPADDVFTLIKNYKGTS